MCVIVYKPDDYIQSEKDRIILLDILDKCSWANPDLCGYMYQENGFVIIRKGFEYLQDMLDTISDDILLTKDIVFHFRIATHGKVIPENSHPFPITSELELLTSNHVMSELGIAHNGTLYGSPTTDYFKGKYSDTFLFIKMVLSSLDKTGLDYILKRESNSNKFCVMSGDEITFYGNFQEHKGLQVSNTNFVWKQPKTINLNDPESCNLITTNTKPFYGNCIYCSQELWKHEQSSGICSDCLSWSKVKLGYTNDDTNDDTNDPELYSMVTCNICDNTLTTSKFDIEYSKKAYGFYMCAYCEKTMKLSIKGDNNNEDENS